MAFEGIAVVQGDVVACNGMVPYITAGAGSVLMSWQCRGAAPDVAVSTWLVPTSRQCRGTALDNTANAGSVPMFTAMQRDRF
jgi:hypothetical protein